MEFTKAAKRYELDEEIIKRLNGTNHIINMKHQCVKKSFILMFRLKTNVHMEVPDKLELRSICQYNFTGSGNIPKRINNSIVSISNKHSLVVI